MKECKCCGAPLKVDYWGRSKCEYCGTDYSNANERVSYVQYGNYYEPKKLQAEVRVHNYMLRYESEEMKRAVIKELVQQFIEELPNYMTIEKNYNIEQDSTTYRATLRVFK